MKKLMYGIALTVSIFSSLKATTNIDKVTDPKESIKYAIKKSRPDLLKKALTNFELSESDKNWLLIYANEVAQIRKNKMNLNLINPKPRRMPHGGYPLTYLGILGISGCLLAGLLNEETFKENTLVSLFFSGIIVSSAVLTIKKLREIADKANKEYFNLNPYRNPKQKYLDSICVLEIIQSI